MAGDARSSRPIEADGPSIVWSGLLLYRPATWRGASGNGRTTAAPVLRAMAKTLRAGAPKVPPVTLAYLNTIAFRCENEPDDFALVETQKVVHVGRVFSADDIGAGRAFLERWSLPLADPERSHIRALIAELGSGRAPATEGRRSTQMRAILRWWADEGPVAKNLMSRLGVIRGTSISTLGDDEAIPMAGHGPIPVKRASTGGRHENPHQAANDEAAKPISDGHRRTSRSVRLRASQEGPTRGFDAA